MRHRSNPIRDHARDLRSNMSREEDLLWQHLRGRGLLGVKFRRKHPLRYRVRGSAIPRTYYADFYSHEYRLIVDIEAPLGTNEAAYNESALQILATKHHVIRIGTDEVADTELVLSKIADVIAKLDTAATDDEM